MLDGIDKYECIFTNFENSGQSWGFVKRSSGNWSWCSVIVYGAVLKDGNETYIKRGGIDLTNKVGDAYQAVLVDKSGGRSLEKNITPGRELSVSTELFNKIFPQRPESLECVPFSLDGATVEASLQKAAADGQVPNQPAD